MLTTNPFSIRTVRGMGEFDSPGTYRERGVERGTRTAREDVFEAELRQVRAERAGSLPPPTSLSVQAFSSRRERVHRGFGDDETNGFEIQY